MSEKQGLSIRNLSVVMRNKRSSKQILDGVNVDVAPGTVTGLVGESGSGKTMTGMAVLGLLPDQAETSGEILYGGVNLLDLKERELARYRGNEIAAVFQDPTAAFHPMRRIVTQMTDHYRVHTKASKAEARERALELLERVRVPRAQEALDKYPHQFSGGQLQRIAIATGLMCRPSVLIADEVTTALDVTVQAGVIRLLRELCDDLGLAVLLVTHDLGVMSALADQVAVMQAGRVIERGDRYSVITAPQHPYTRSLIESLPQMQKGE